MTEHDQYDLDEAEGYDISCCKKEENLLLVDDAVVVCKVCGREVQIHLGE